MDHAVPSRPYSLVKGSEASPTEIIGVLDKPGMHHAAAREAAAFAVMHPDRWQHLEEEDAINRLASHPQGVWDGRAAMGTLIHWMLEQYCNGALVHVEDAIEWALENNPKAREWKTRDYDDLYREVISYMDGLDDWWSKFQPTACRSETVVRWPGLWVGTTDLRCEINGEDWIVDLKTFKLNEKRRKRLDENPRKPPGLYTTSWTYQLAYYGMARETVAYGVEEAEGGKRPADWRYSEWKRGWRVVETGTGPWSPPDRYGIIHLLGSSRLGWESFFWELDVTREVKRDALRLARFYYGQKRIPQVPRRIVLEGEEQVA